ncbi:MAG: hypothetical protein Q4D16_24385 [Eubacteriales bacterium]|nr:hypothetical protein [Eubacteriales bacterium]
MYQLLLKQRYKFAVRMLKRNIGAYFILIAIVPCIHILQSIIQEVYGKDIAVLIPYGILCFLFMNLFGTILRMRISPEAYIWKIEKAYIWRVKKIGKSMVLTGCVALILSRTFPMEGMVLRQFIVVMFCNPMVNIHTVLSTEYRRRDITNICMLAVVMICFFYGLVFVAGGLLIVYGLYFVLYPYFSYQAIIPFFQQYDHMLYGYLNREYGTVLQTQDEVFFQNNKKEMKGVMKKYYGSRYRFLMVYEIVSVVRRKKQVLYQYFAIVLITMLLSQVNGKYIKYALLFSILILGQNVISYNAQNELRLVKKGFPFIYSLKEKLQCKSIIGMLLLLLPMICYWMAYRIELFSIILLIWTPIQSIIIYSAKTRLQRLLYMLPFYILSFLSMRVWQIFL